MAGIYNPEVYLPKLPAKDAVTPTAIRAWQVLHACEQVRDLLPVIEGQLAVGMRPYLATPRGAGAAALFLRQVPQPVQTASLLTAWSDVRRWRSSIVDSVPGMEVVHAHLFSAGMAAVRNCPAVVYDVTEFVEQIAIASGQCSAGSWLARSFRVAEQFVLARASAVVVHDTKGRDGAIERGVLRENLFVIFRPAEYTRPENVGRQYDRVYQHAYKRRSRSPGPSQTAPSLTPIRAA